MHIDFGNVKIDHPLCALALGQTVTVTVKFDVTGIESFDAPGASGKYERCASVRGDVAEVEVGGVREGGGLDPVVESGKRDLRVFMRTMGTQG